MSTATAPTTLPESGAATSPAELARQFLYYMSLMREVEDRIERKLYRQGKIVGGVYVGRGQEAIPVGTRAAGRTRTTCCFPRHRDMARVSSSAACTPRQIFAQYMGRIGGLTRGRDGNMHMGDLKLNIVAIISAMAASRAGGRRRGAGAASTRARRNVALLLLRRRRHQPRRLARGRQPRRRPEAARGADLQQQPVRLLDAARKADGLRATWPTAGRPTASRPRSWTATTSSRCTRPPRRAVAHARAGHGPVPAGVQDLPHDRPLGARPRRLRAQAPVRGVGREATPSRGWSGSCSSAGWADARGDRRAPRAHPRAKWTRPSSGPKQSPFPDPSELLRQRLRREQ